MRLASRVPLGSEQHHSGLPRPHAGPTLACIRHLSHQAQAAATSACNCAAELATPAKASANISIRSVPLACIWPSPAGCPSHPTATSEVAAIQPHCHTAAYVIQCVACTAGAPVAACVAGCSGISKHARGYLACCATIRSEVRRSFDRPEATQQWHSSAAYCKSAQRMT